jgi:hypothetical protein
MALSSSLLVSAVALFILLFCYKSYIKYFFEGHVALFLIYKKEAAMNRKISTLEK